MNEFSISQTNKINFSNCYHLSRQLGKGRLHSFFISIININKKSEEITQYFFKLVKDWKKSGFYSLNWASLTKVHILKSKESDYKDYILKVVKLLVYPELFENKEMTDLKIKDLNCIFKMPEIFLPKFSRFLDLELEALHYDQKTHLFSYYQPIIRLDDEFNHLRGPHFSPMPYENQLIQDWEILDDCAKKSKLNAIYGKEFINLTQENLKAFHQVRENFFQDFLQTKVVKEIRRIKWILLENLGCDLTKIKAVKAQFITDIK